MTIRRPIWRWIFIGLTLLWMGLIFRMSSKTGDISLNESGRIVSFLQQIFFRRWDALPEEQFQILLGRLGYLVRKLAHFMEFAVLGAGLSMIMMTFEERFCFRFGIAFAAGLLYAVSDEIHQLFVGGRDGAVFDVLIDAAGVFAGCMIVLGLFAMAASDGRRIRRHPDPGNKIPDDGSIETGNAGSK